MFLVAPYDFACAVVIDIACTEHRLQIVRPVGIELLQVVEELRGDVLEVYLRVNVDDGTGLLGQDVL